MEPRIRPEDHKKHKVEGEHVPSARPEFVPDKKYAETPAEIPTQIDHEEALDAQPGDRASLAPVFDPESKSPEISPEQGWLRRKLGSKVTAIAAGLSLLGGGAFVGIKSGAIKFSSGGEVVAASTPFPTTTPPKVVAPPPRHETATSTPKEQIWNTVYNLRGEPKTLEQMKNDDFTVSLQEAPSVELATKNLETVFKSIGNFGIKETNLGVTGNSEEEMIAYNKKLLLDTDLLENTGLTDIGGGDYNLLKILVEQNAQNIENRTFTKVEISNIQKGSTASMNGESTTSATATLTLSQPAMGANSSLEKKSYILTWYVSYKGGSNWEPVKGSVGLRPL